MSKDRQRQIDTIEGLEKDLADLMQAEAKADQEGREAKGKTGFVLDEEYATLKASAREATAADASLLESLQRQQVSDERTSAQLVTESDSLEDKAETDQERLDELSARLESMQGAVKETKQAHQACTKELASIEEEDSTDQRPGNKPPRCRH